MLRNSPIKLRRLNALMNVEDVAMFLGIKKTAMYKIEQGYQKPTISIAVKLSEIYECSIEDICKDFGIDTKVNWDI